MDDRSFDTLTRTLAGGETRRRLLGALVALPAASGLLGLLDADDAGAKGRRRRRVKKHKHGKGRRSTGKSPRSKPTPQACAPESMAQTCAGTCGSITNTCGEIVECGSCACTPSCGACHTCQERPNTPGACVIDAAQRDLPCGDQGQVCHADGACACDANSCAAGQRCHGTACICDGGSCAAGCCTDGACVEAAAQSDSQCGTDGDACTACGTGETCCQGQCVATCTGGKVLSDQCECVCPGKKVACGEICCSPGDTCDTGICQCGSSDGCANGYNCVQGRCAKACPPPGSSTTCACGGCCREDGGLDWCCGNPVGNGDCRNAPICTTSDDCPAGSVCHKVGERCGVRRCFQICPGD